MSRPRCTISTQNWKSCALRSIIVHQHLKQRHSKRSYDTFCDTTKNHNLGNLGYLTLGLLIHRVSGQFYGDLLHDRVFVPLGMNSTRIISEQDIILNRAAGYRLVKGELKNQEWVSPKVNTTADGSLYFSILDLAKWDTALREGKLVSAESYKLMWTPFVLNDASPIVAVTASGGSSAV
jgi:CubicO group peptidase (beta-lactamase class C family)